MHFGRNSPRSGLSLPKPSGDSDMYGVVVCGRVSGGVSGGVVVCGRVSGDVSGASSRTAVVVVVSSRTDMCLVVVVVVGARRS